MVFAFCLVQEISVNRNIEYARGKPSVEIIREPQYEFVVIDCSWQEAYEACVVSGGHLVTIETEAEYQNVIELIESKGYAGVMFYIGALRENDGNNYHWINADEFSIDKSEHWLEGEPSFMDFNLDVEEYYVQLMYSNKFEKWVYNDIPNELLQCVPVYKGKVGYICEYD